jgi:polyferredoxin
MEKVNRPKGLIRYDSYTGIKEKKHKRLTVRVMAYSAVLLALIGLQVFLFATRTEVEALVLRSPGQLYQKVDENTLRNVYSWEVINKTTQDIGNIRFLCKNFPEANIQLVGAQADVVSPKQGLAKGVMMIDLPKSEVKKQKTKLIIEVYSRDKIIDKTTTNFLGPIQ